MNFAQGRLGEAFLALQGAQNVADGVLHLCILVDAGLEVFEDLGREECVCHIDNTWDGV